jgi:predicted phage terminase large subunit-like protein
MQLPKITTADRDLIEAELCRRSVLYFAKTFWPVLEPGRKLVTGWPIEAIAEHLEAVTRGEIRKLLITVPPGSMKSLLTRAFWPSWSWIAQPSLRYIGASYAEALAARDNRRAKMIVESPLYQRLFPHVRLSDDQAQKVNFANTSTGSMMATSVRGRATGERGDVFVIDDPHNVLEAESEAIRSETLQWFREVVPSRVNDLDRSSFACIMQRVHHEDVAAAAIEQGYEHLLIPMHYDPSRARTTSIGWKDPRTEPGDLMWPERFSARAVAELETTLGIYAASAQLEQRPTPREGGLFKADKIQTIDAVPHDEEIVWCRAWDLAATDGGGAYTAGVLVGWRVAARRVIIAGVRRERVGPEGVRKLIEDTAGIDGDDVPISIPQDPGQAGKAQARDFTVRLAGYRVRIEPQTGSKETRAEPLAAQVEAGNVDIVTGQWNRDFIEELRHFPRGVYKDQVDAASSAFNAVAPKRQRKTGLFVVGDHVGNRARPG